MASGKKYWELYKGRGKESITRFSSVRCGVSLCFQSIFKDLDPRIKLALIIAEVFLLKRKHMTLSSLVIYICVWVQLAMDFHREEGGNTKC